jgi:oligopeptide/dipeptide ABC transporter ATP-binding protein
MPGANTSTPSSSVCGLRPNPGSGPLLDVRGLTATYRVGRYQEIFAVDNVSFHLQPSRVLGLVGESGCGKTTCGLSVLRLVRPPGGIRSGQILFRGEDLALCSKRRLHELRGEKLAMIFQNPMSSLNPTEHVGAQIIEVLRTHRSLPKRECDERVCELLDLVGIPSPERCKDSYPHELSGGMRQRVLIAMALALNPEFLVADEPTTAVDVTIQAQILWLLEDLQQRLGMAMVYITHDLLVAASMCHEIAVMYGGFIVEQAPTGELFEHPAHPYTSALLSAMPQVSWRAKRVEAIPGQPPILVGRMVSCPFVPRCPLALPSCSEEVPPVEEVAAGHVVRCFRWQDNL